MSEPKEHFEAGATARHERRTDAPGVRSPTDLVEGSCSAHPAGIEIVACPSKIEDSPTFCRVKVTVVLECSKGTESSFIDS